VTLSIKSVGDQPEHFSDSNRKAFGATGAADYTPDSGASRYADRGQRVWGTEINPGNTLSASIVFDVPRDAKSPVHS